MTRKSSGRAQDAAAEVVEQDARDPREIDRQIAGGLRHDVLRRPHEPQRRADGEPAQRGGDHAGDERQRHGRMHGFAQSLVIMRAVALGNDHGRAGGKARAEAHDGVDDRRDGPDRRLRLLADELSDHQRVHGIVELLEQKADRHRNRKAHHMLPDIPPGHIQIHPHPRHLPPRNKTELRSNISHRKRKRKKPAA